MVKTIKDGDNIRQFRKYIMFPFGVIYFQLIYAKIHSKQRKLMGQQDGTMHDAAFTNIFDPMICISWK